MKSNNNTELLNLHLKSQWFRLVSMLLFKSWCRWSHLKSSSKQTCSCAHVFLFWVNRAQATWWCNRISDVSLDHNYWMSDSMCWILLQSAQHSLSWSTELKWSRSQDSHLLSEQKFFYKLTGYSKERKPLDESERFFCVHIPQVKTSFSPHTHVCFLSDEIGVIPCPEARYNRSPIVLVENKLGVESWCVKFLLPYVHNKLLLYRQRKQWLDREGKRAQRAQNH